MRDWRRRGAEMREGSENGGSLSCPTFCLMVARIVGI